VSDAAPATHLTVPAPTAADSHPVIRTLTAPDHAMLGIWIFLSAECAFFASLIGTYLVLHTQTAGGLGPSDLLGTPTLIGTLVLLTSSFTMVLGVSALQDGNPGRMRMWLGWTALLGLVFLGFQAYEFHNFYVHGLTLQSSAFGSAFFTLTGFHGMHVAFGVFWILSLIVWSLKKKEIKKEWISKFQVAGLYWHFVDMVWVVIFTVVYLVGKAG
jgi:cytochrome c oxidase subunit 3